MPKLKGWIVVKAKEGYGTYLSPSPYAGQQRIKEDLQFVKFTVSKPSVNTDEVAFQYEMEVDESWFLESPAQIKASVGPAPTAAQSITATVDMPVRGRGKSAAASVIKNP